MESETYIVIATEEEFKLVPDDYISNPVIVTGVGGLNVYKKLKDIPRYSNIINVGYVGSNNFEIGSGHHITNCKSYHPNSEFEEESFGCGTLKEFNYAKDGLCLCYTSSDFVLNTDIEEDVVFDMELAYILAMGFTNVASYKVVSDNLNYQEYEVNINGRET